MDNRNKYRVWDTETKKMIDFEGLRDASYLIGDEIVINSGVFYPFYEKGLIFMQCTGLSAAKSYRGDKPEDLLVFEGDIVKRTREITMYRTNEFVENEIYTGAVIYCQTMFCVDLGYKKPLLKGHNDNSIYEIIGNIYEHPELLTNPNPD